MRVCDSLELSPPHHVMNFNPANVFSDVTVEAFVIWMTVVFVEVLSHDRLRPTPTSKNLPHHDGTTSLDRPCY